MDYPKGKSERRQQGATGWGRRGTSRRTKPLCGSEETYKTIWSPHCSLQFIAISFPHSCPKGTQPAEIQLAKILDTQHVRIATARIAHRTLMLSSRRCQTLRGASRWVFAVPLRSRSAKARGSQAQERNTETLEESLFFSPLWGSCFTTGQNHQPTPLWGASFSQVHDSQIV